MKILITLFVLIYFQFDGHTQTPQNYTTFQGATLSLYAWEGNNIMLLSVSDTLDSLTMNNWVLELDTAYNYYSLCTGREPNFNTGGTYLNNRSTIAQVYATCGAGCGYLGTTGIELLDNYFMNMYAYIQTQNKYDQIAFYELGRNFWFYDDKLRYTQNDPIVTGYAVFMRFMSMEAAGVVGAPFNLWTFDQFKDSVKNLLPLYLSDTSLNWTNTLGSGLGIPNSSLGATDLFASFCFYLHDNYCGSNWVEHVWKYSGLRPNAVNTQESVDNFIIASSQAANTNLISLFQSWKWPVTSNVINYLATINLSRINLQPINQTVNTGSNATFSIATSDSNAHFQWQLLNGVTFQNMIDTGVISGANTSTLFFTNVNITNNNYSFRCIVSIGTCTDTSNIVVLSVINTTDLTENNIVESIRAYQAPTFDKLIIESNHILAAEDFIIIDLAGRNICSGKLNGKLNSIPLQNFQPGIYYLLIEKYHLKLLILDCY